MARSCLLLLLVAGVAWSAGPPVVDPLPPGAKLRVGTPRFRHGGHVRSLAFSPDGQWLASASLDQTVSVWEVPTGHERCRLRGHKTHVLCVDWSRDGRRLASGGADGNVYLWEPSTGRELHRMSTGAASIEALAFAPDGQRLAIGGDDGIVRVIDVTSRKDVARIRQDRCIDCLAWSPNGKFLATNSTKEAIAIRDARTGKLVRFLGEEAVQCLAFSPSGEYLVSREGGGLFRLWNVASGKEVRAWQGSADSGGCASMIYQIAFRGNSNLLLAGNLQGGIDEWDVETGKRTTNLQGRHQTRVMAVAVSPHGDLVASAGADHAIHLWRAATGQAITAPLKRAYWPDFEAKQLPADDGSPVVAVAGARDGKGFASSHRDGSLWLRAGEGKRLRQLGSDLGHVQPVLSPDGSLVAVVGREALARVWDTKTGKAHDPLPGHRGGTLAAAFSTDNKRLVTGGRDDRLRLWDVANRKQLFAATHTAFVTAVAFASDGHRIASGTVRGEVVLWSAETGVRLAEFSGHRGEVSGLCFTTDGKTLVSASRDTTVLVWDVEKKR